MKTVEQVLAEREARLAPMREHNRIVHWRLEERSKQRDLEAYYAALMLQDNFFSRRECIRMIHKLRKRLALLKLHLEHHQ